MSMTIEQKSLELAKLMGWYMDEPFTIGDDGDSGIAWTTLQPYDGDSLHGLAQFAAILLKFPDVMASRTRYVVASMNCNDEEDCAVTKWDWRGIYLDGKGGEQPDATPTQANILDEILRMNGVEI